jgi:4-amino-4-deoxy-L-arabinose transferase-like glycosyltransferase
MDRDAGLERALPLLALTLLGLVLRFWRLGELSLIGDESYYWLWSRHLDWAYFDHPAGIALVTWFSTALGGHGEAAVRWLNALLGAACVPLVYLLGAQMLSRRAGLIAATAVAVGAPYLLTSRFVYTDAIQLLLLLLNMYIFWRLTRSRMDRPLPLGLCLAFGLSLALLFNTKYSAYLYAGALSTCVLIDHRWMLARRGFVLAALIGVLGLLPVIAWNASHGWASFRWQLTHMGFSLSGKSNLAGNLYHSLTYLSWPLVVLSLAGLFRVRTQSERLLTLVALYLLLPIALSPANSPRNLANGLAALLLLAGARWPAAVANRRQRWIAGFLAASLSAIAVYGVGTLLNLSGPSPWPHSSAVHAIRRDAAGWRSMGTELATYSYPLFALDYSIASQIRYYGDKHAYTAWPQYLIWGLPDLDNVTVVSLEYLPEELVTGRLVNAFENVDGPRAVTYEERDTVKEVRIWQAEGLRLDSEAFLEQFDFLALIEAAR